MQNCLNRQFFLFNIKNFVYYICSTWNYFFVYYAIPKILKLSYILRSLYITFKNYFKIFLKIIDKIFCNINYYNYFCKVIKLLHFKNSTLWMLYKWTTPSTWKKLKNFQLKVLDTLLKIAGKQFQPYQITQKMGITWMRYITARWN